MTTHDDRELAASSGAYALNALEGQDARDFESLLQRSPGLREEVTELSDTAVELALAVAPEDPPVELRARLLAAIATTPQLAAETDVAETGIVETGTETEAETAEPEPALAPVIALAWYRRPAGALAAAAAAVVLAVGGTLGVGIVQSATAASQVAAIAAAPDAAHATARVAGGGTARIVWSDELGRSGLELDGMPALDLGRTYQLWYIHGSTARSAGTTAAVSDVVLDGSMRAGDVIGITVEPAGGSTAPTSSPILAVPTA